MKVVWLERAPLVLLCTMIWLDDMVLLGYRNMMYLDVCCGVGEVDVLGMLIG
jgi:hypothetical protein